MVKKIMAQKKWAGEPLPALTELLRKIKRLQKTLDLYMLATICLPKILDQSSS
jgi:hypothetical protein